MELKSFCLTMSCCPVAYLGKLRLRDVSDWLRVREQLQGGTKNQGQLHKVRFLIVDRAYGLNRPQCHLTLKFPKSPVPL